MYSVELQAVRKSYGAFVAVDDLSLRIKAGEVYGLLGPNGAGKTSTIRMIIGITLPDSGQISLFGEPFRRQHLERVGYLPEERGLYKKMKIIDQLVFLGSIRGLSTAEALKRSKQWCERMEMTDWMPKKVEELSKGMQQKIQFIAALLHEPDFIIMDEPFSGLDPVNTARLKDILIEQKNAGKTIMFSTHRMDTVERLCDSICLVNRGKSVLEGSLKEIKSRFGKNNVHIEYDGNGDFLGQEALVQSFNNYGNYVEVRLHPGGDAQELLRAVASRSRVNKFEVVEPSLEQIFIETVKESDA